MAVRNLLQVFAKWIDVPRKAWPYIWQQLRRVDKTGDRHRVQRGSVHHGC